MRSSTGKRQAADDQRRARRRGAGPVLRRRQVRPEPHRHYAEARREDQHERARPRNRDRSCAKRARIRCTRGIRAGARPGRAGTLRSCARQGFLRRRLHRRHQRQEVAPDGRGRDRHSLQSGASRGGRCRPARRRRRRHPGADPAQVLRQEGASARFRVAETRRIRGRRAVHATRSGLASGDPRHLFPDDQARRHGAPRLARRADRQLHARRIGEADRARAPAGVHRSRQEDQERGRVRAAALHPAQVDVERDLHPQGAQAVGLLPGVDLLSHRGLQGHVPRRSARHLLSRPARRDLRDRAGAGPPALLDQYVPDLVARPSLPDDRAQRRDQHAARQRELDGGAAGVGVVGPVRRGHPQAVADLLRGPVRHRLLRQRARVPGAGRLLARPCHDDDDSRGLGRKSAHGRGAARLLRVQCGADGAVGRSGRDRVHQRPPDRRHARPQRLAPGTLLRHPRRAHHHGLGNGRAADRGTRHRAEVAPAAGQDAARRSRPGPPHPRRGAQAHAGEEPSLQGVARAHPDRARGPACGGGPSPALQSRAARSSTGPSATRRRICAS